MNILPSFIVLYTCYCLRQQRLAPTRPSEQHEASVGRGWLHAHRVEAPQTAQCKDQDSQAPPRQKIRCSLLFLHGRLPWLESIWARTLVVRLARCTCMHAPAPPHWQRDSTTQRSPMCALHHWQQLRSCLILGIGATLARPTCSSAGAGTGTCAGREGIPRTTRLGALEASNAFPTPQRGHYS